MKTKSKFGCVFILMSGVLFTFERYFSILIWSTLTSPILQKGNGGYEGSPDMPNLHSNPFVILFLLIGVSLVILEIYDFYSEKTSRSNELKK